MSSPPALRVIPVWVRLLAAVVVAAAVLAIVLLLRGVPGQVIDTPAFIRRVAQAILYLSLIALFGYVAASGLPPTHWWRGAGQPLWRADTEPQLAPELHRYLALLHARHPGIRECWLLDTPEQGAWRLLAIAEVSGLDAVRADWDIRRKTVRLYLLEAHSRTVAVAWGRSSPVPFAAWDWEPQSDVLAEFRCPATGEIRLARRLWR